MAASSSLTAQLKQLAGAHVPGSSKGRASLLFSAKQAADIDSDSLFDIGRAALTDLCTHNLAFGEFEKSLFSEAFKNLDRSLQTKEENVLIDNTIAKFLRLLSPHFLLQSSFKALEWLIRRFRVNELNVDHMMECILPYHETKQFVQVVAILGLEDTSRWAFLKGIQKSKVPLDRVTLVQRLKNDKSILQFICDMAATSQTNNIVNRTLWTFFACTLIQYVQSLTVVSDESIRVLFAPLLTLLTVANPQFADLLVTSQMVFTQIASRTPLNPEIVIAIVQNTVSGLNPGNLHNALIFLLTIYRSQNLETFPTASLEKLLAQPQAANVVAQLNATYEADALLRAILTTAVQHLAITEQNGAKVEHFVSVLIKKGNPTFGLLKSFVATTFDVYLEGKAKQRIVGGGARLRNVLNMLQNSHPGLVDNALEHKLQDAGIAGNKAQREILYDFVSTSFKGTAGEVLKDSSTTLYLSLQHVDVGIRVLALEKLGQLIAAGDAKSFGDLEHIILTRLQDNDDVIVKAVFALPNLTSLVKPTNLTRAMQMVLRSESVGAKNKIRAFDLCAQLLEASPNASADTKVDLLPFFSLTNGNRKVVKHAFAAGQKTALGSLVAGLETLADKIEVSEGKAAKGKKTGSVKEVAASALEILARNAVKAGVPATELYVKGLASDSQIGRTLSALVLVRSLGLRTPSERLVLAAQIIPALFDKLTTFELNDESPADVTCASRTGVPSDAAWTSIISLSQAESASGAFDAVILMDAVQNTIALSVKPTDASVSWFGASTADTASYESFVVMLFERIMALNSTQARETLLLSVIEHHLRMNVVDFCAAFASRQDFSAPSRAAAWTVAAAYLKITADDSVLMKYDYQLVVPCLLAALVDENASVRQAALNCLQSIKLNYTKCLGESKSKGKGHKKPNVQIFSYDQFYGKSTESVQYLTTDAAASFVATLLEGAEELSTDASFLDRYILAPLTAKGSSKSGAHYKEDLLSFLLTNVLAMPITSAKIALLKILESVDSPLKIKTLLPALETTVKTLRDSTTTRTDMEEAARLMAILVKCFTPGTMANLFKQKSDKWTRAFCQLLDSREVGAVAVADYPSVSLLALEQVHQAAFGFIPVDRQNEIFSAVVKLAYDGDSDTVQQAKEVLRRVDITWELVAAQFATCQKALKATEGRPAKKGKTGVAETTDTFYRLSALLETLEYKQNVAEKHKLVGPLFELLSCILNAEISNIPGSVEYVKQLIFSVALSLFQAVKEHGLYVDETSLRVDLIVQCIRVTDNPQTHNACLLLMAAIATVYPESVLLSIMPVFTFMGANVLRQDDNYSFHVIQQALTTIIPALVAKYHVDNKDNKQQMLHEVKPIVGVFVDALVHIPKHRRLRLFTVLISTLGPDAFLDMVILLLLAKHSSKNKLPAHGTEGLVEFILSLIVQFSVTTQLTALTSMIQTVSGLPFDQSEVDGSDSRMAVDHVGIIDPSAHSAKELRQLKLSTVDFANRLLGNKQFITKALTVPDAEIEAYLLDLIEANLLFITTINAHQAFNGKNASSASGKFAVTLNNVLYDVLGKANGLLSVPAFLSVVSKLMKHDSHSIRRKAINLLDSKVTAIADDIDESLLPEFTRIAEDLRVIVVDADESGDALEDKQTALLCLTTMARIMASDDVETYVKILQSIISEHILSSKNSQIAASAMVCLTAICVQVGSKVLSFLPKFMPAILKNLQNVLDSQDAEAKQLMVLGSLGSLDALVDTVPQFVSPYVYTILELGFRVALVNAKNGGVQDRVSEKSNELLTNVAEKVAPRIMLPAIFTYLKTALPAGRHSMLALFDLVGKTISHMSRTDLTQYRMELFRFFLVAFDYRRIYADTVTEDDIETVENSIISAFLQLVMKLNETLFKPLFLKMVDWATSELLVKHGLSEKDVNARQLFLYRLVDSLLGRLKSIFAPYYAYVLTNSITKLEAYKESKKTDALWINIVSSLHKCFLYDSDGFIDADKFETLLHPLVDQIDALDVNAKDYIPRVTRYLVPCIGQLAVTVGKDTLWKPLNHQVLMKTRSEHANVRLVALKVLQELYTRLGEEMLILFPETIPFLAELMEDTDEEVEKACQDVCAQIQQYIGEDIQQYFSA
ncbi:uncharacterized protein EV422DRAFT_585585 [Fimicolochytrium jonesii]|uniref:uncharacterized protein n=1 Tax=Fimicolochytrium jonesii TaxID=1396493 RepID=UPI0022FE76C4|nr:uncharacterized protein EV422DRAFT_585585 [Fimicolochytrium jonesii]KAI8823046.1 hypothetical protein EV422DRAFT_585585 [Fimicolochytrium jonesii]